MVSQENLRKRWQQMVKRCHDPEHRDYRWYGARGIIVCERWHDLANFEADIGDMGGIPDGLTIDRIDNDRGYEPGNIRFVAQAFQNRNMRSNRKITHEGKTQVLAEWASDTGIGASIISRRLKRGWSTADALLKPIKPNARASRPVTRFVDLDGVTMPLMTAAKLLGVHRKTLRKRIQKLGENGWLASFEGRKAEPATNQAALV